MKLLSLITLMFACSVNATTLNEVRWLAEDVPPFNYIDENNAPSGIYVDILIEMWALLKVNKTKHDIEIVSWARGMKELNKDPKVCLFSMGSTKAREQKYRLLNTSLFTHYTLIAKKSKKFEFKNIKEVNLSMNKRSIGVLVEDISFHKFVDKGGSQSLVEPVGDLDRLVKMLAKDRVEMIAFAEKPTREILLGNKENPADYEIVLSLAKTFDAYAFNKSVNSEVFEKLEWAYNKLKESGKIDQIVRKYEHYPRISR